MIRVTIVVIVCALLLVVPASAEPTGGPVPGSELASAPQALSQCLTRSSTLDVIFLIDESGSLTTTDPHTLRVDGIQSALAGLARLASVPVNGHRTSVNVLFEGFAGAVDPDPFTSSSSAWTNLSEGTLAEAEAKAATFRSRHYAPDTDYALALRDARVFFQHEAVSQTLNGGAAPCKALIWATDGGYEISPRVGPLAKRLPVTELYAPTVKITSPAAAARAERVGKAYLCRRGGLLDGLASDDVVRFTVGLSKLMTTEQQSFLEAATVGSGGSTTCGARLSHASGEYLGVAKADCLFFVLGGILEESGCPPLRRLVCSPSICERGANAFQAPAGINAFVIRATTGGKHITLHLRAPDGREAVFVPLHDETKSVGGVRLAASWLSERTIELEGTLPEKDRSWVGPWTYTFVDPAGNEPNAVPISDVSLRTALHARLVGNPHLIRGTTTRVTIELANPATSSGAANPLLAGASLTASVTNPLTGAAETVTVEPGQRPSTYTLYVPVPTATTANGLFVNVEATFPSVSSTTILPVRGSFSLQVALPAGQGYPTISPQALTLHPITGSGHATGTLNFTGTAGRAGCFWAGASTTQPPSETRHASTSVTPATSKSTCIPVAKGEHKSLTVKLTVAGAGYGLLHVVVPVYLHSGITGGTARVDVSGTAELLPAANVTKRVAILIALLAVGTLLPFLLLWLLNWWAALFPPTDEIRVLSREVEVQPDGTLRPVNSDEPTTTYYDSDFKPLDKGMRRSRHIDVNTATTAPSDDPLPLIRLRGIAAAGIRDLFRGPLGQAMMDDHRLVVPGEGSSRLWNDGDTVEVPLALWDTWLFCPRHLPSPGPYGGSEDTRVRGRLVMFIRDGGDVAAGGQLLERAGMELASHDWRRFSAFSASKPSLHERLSFLRRLKRDTDDRDEEEVQEYGSRLTEQRAEDNRTDKTEPGHKEGSRL